MVPPNWTDLSLRLAPIFFRRVVYSSMSTLRFGKHYVTIILIAIACLSFATPCEAKVSPEAIRLNSEGVEALSKRDWDKSFTKFKAALKIDPDYSRARENLAIAHKNYSMHLCEQEHKPAEALIQMHEALS